jgi:hypothetical protein
MIQVALGTQEIGESARSPGIQQGPAASHAEFSYPGESGPQDSSSHYVMKPGALQARDSQPNTSPSCTPDRDSCPKAPRIASEAEDPPTTRRCCLAGTPA